MIEIRESFSIALAFLIKRKKIVQNTLAKDCGMSPASLSDYKYNRKEGREPVRRKLATALGYSYEGMLKLGDRLLRGDAVDDAYLKSLQVVSRSGAINAQLPPIQADVLLATPHTIYNVEPAEMPHGRRVPLISFVMAGDWTSTVDNFQPGDAEEWVPFPGNIGPHAFALRVNGPSMEPKFVEGDIIFVDPDREAESGDFIIAKNGADEATFKKFYRDGDRCFLVPLNEDWGKPMEMTGRDWKIVGRVMGKLDLF